MNTTPIMFTPNQMQHIQAYIEERFGKCEDLLMHEIESHYIHTDIAVATSTLDEPTFITFGMSARPTEAPLKEFSRTELVMYASPALTPVSREGAVIGGELARLTRYPFANDTWFGAGHTIDASNLFKETFGYDAFLLVYGGDVYTSEEGDEVRFLMLVPLYTAEREFIMEHGHTGFLHALFDKYGNTAFHADVVREAVTVEEAEGAVRLEDILDVDEDALNKLRTMLEEAAARDEVVSYEELTRWVQELGKD